MAYYGGLYGLNNEYYKRMRYESGRTWQHGSWGATRTSQATFRFHTWYDIKTFSYLFRGFSTIDSSDPDQRDWSTEVTMKLYVNGTSVYETFSYVPPGGQGDVQFYYDCDRVEYDKRIHADDDFSLSISITHGYFYKDMANRKYASWGYFPLDPTNSTDYPAPWTGGAPGESTEGKGLEIEFYPPFQTLSYPPAFTGFSRDSDGYPNNWGVWKIDGVNNDGFIWITGFEKPDGDVVYVVTDTRLIASPVFVVGPSHELIKGKVKVMRDDGTTGEGDII